MFSQQNSVQAAAVLGCFIALSASIGAFALYRVRALDNTLTVTGSATERTVADAAKLTVSVSRLVFEDALAGAQSAVARDAAAVAAFFSTSGIPSENILTSPVYVDREYSSDANAPRRYNVRIDTTIRSDNPRAVEKLSKDVSTLSQRGIIVSVNMPEYYVTTLPQLRISLIGKAVQDAHARAMEIASSTGQKVGALKSASSGVVQVMAPNSVDVSDYGSYDTSTIEKQVMVTTRAVFLLK